MSEKINRKRIIQIDFRNLKRREIESQIFTQEN
jgi:hypothetical protein